ncbi:zinc-dependent metalloprotease [Aestuariivivens insulae]|uniref:zinc-dependent metalloprotease n=1 Tax=Aestuariivivens insulae TaxID=1621988 RepID=UPI001F56A979|nr:zinc-dependent metalloprotease family protein [Aestuariivivens insulae]
MKKAFSNFTIVFLLILLFFSSTLYTQNGKTIWTKTSQEKAFNGKLPNKDVKQNRASYYQLDIESLKTLLKDAPLRNNNTTSDIIISFPNSEGTLEAFRINEAPLFKPDFQKKHPELRTYVGTSVTNNGNKIRFSITPFGLHAMTLSSEKGLQLIDPAGLDNKYYISYNKSDLVNLPPPFYCKYIDDLGHFKNTSSSKSNSTRNANDGILRTYDLALASTVEYSTYHIDAAGVSGGTDTEKKNAVKAAMMVTMNRVNGIFEREISLTMQMVDNTNIIFIAEPDGYTNDNGQTMLSENQTIIDNAIGSVNYDIGHVFSTGGGGIASLNSPCVSGSKAKGVTGLSAPVGDVFDVEFVAHEMGHQFGAPHTWSSNSGGCSATEWSSTNAYEPGSGSTIMSYAGLCAPDNVQLNGDDYFHQKSLQMIWANISSGNSSNCDTEASSGNTAPTANAGIDYTIPVSTPYKLTGSSTDIDGTGTHTYTWEQFDLATSQGSISENNTTGPLVRSFEPTSDPVRYIPNLKDLRFSNGSTTWEKLASVPRSLNFQLTVRDNGKDNNYGQTDNDEMTITVIDANGPFKVTSQNAYISYPVGSTQTITWNVADTNLSPINTSMVNIRLSIDGGLTYPTILTTTNNDGNADITFPSGVAAPYCRIMIEADPSQNIFFSINEENFSIGYTITETCNQYSGGTNLPISIPDNGNSFETSTISVSESSTITDLNVGVNITHTYKGDLQIALVSPESTQINLTTQSFCSTGSLMVKFDDSSTQIDCAYTENNEVYKPTGDALNNFNGENPSGNWTLGIIDLADGDTGTLNSWYIELCTTSLTLDNPAFNNISSLKIFPNPNKGEFTITLKGSLSNLIKVEVFDIRGRQIYNNSYKGSGDFNETISLKNAQTGIYILNVNDGNRQSTKKIVID